MIACEHPKIVINQGVYEAVAFTKYIICDGIQHFFYCVSKLNVSVLHQFLSKFTPPEERLDLYYTFDRFGIKVPLYIAVPCRKCLLCRQKDGNILAQRLEFESECHDHMPWFVTLTFSPQFIPADGLLKKSYALVFIARLRDYVRRFYPGTTIRYYYQGEYGEKNGRMHYHLLIFGLPLISFRSALKLFKSSWRSKSYFSILRNGKIERIRPLIGRVGVSQINSKEYRSYYEKTRKRTLKPEDGIHYACKYSSKDSQNCRGWSLGLGKEFVIKYLRPQLRLPNATIEPNFVNRYGKVKPVILSRWLLQTCFDTFNRKTYYLRSNIANCIGSCASLINSHWYFDKYKEIFNFIGIQTFNPLSIRNCYEFLIEHRQKFNPCKAFKSRFAYLQFEHFFDSYINSDFQHYIDDTLLYRDYITRYFSVRPELTRSQISAKLVTAKKYDVKQKTLQLL